MSIYGEYRGAIAQANRIQARLATTRDVADRERLAAELEDIRAEIRSLRHDMWVESRQEDDYDDDGDEDESDEDTDTDEEE